MEDNVISLAEKLEKWKDAYVSPEGDLIVSVSNHGRLSFFSKNEHTKLEFIDSVQLLSELSKSIESSMKFMKLR